MQKRKFDELISHFNRKVSDMSIDQKYKMELLGMISAIGFAHEKEHGTNLAEVGTGCISREQAIDAVRATLLAWSYMPEWRDNKIIEAVKRLPPIQPEIVRCEECKYHYQRNCPIEKYFSLDGFCSRGKRKEVTE